MSTPKPVAYIHINGKRLRSNGASLRTGDGRPLETVVSVRGGRSASPTYAEKVQILDAAGVVVGEVVYEPRRGLACGAKVFVTCFHRPRLVGEGETL